MHIFLETERLILRRFTRADVDNLYGLDNDPEVMRFTTGGKGTSRDDIESDFLPAFLGYYERFEGFGFWAVVEKSTEAFLGWFHFRAKQNRLSEGIELGYRLHKSAWGKGYGTEGSRALIRKGFVEFGVQRVWAGTMAVNLASRRVMEKAGMRYIRSSHEEWPYPIEGSEHGDVEYGITRAEWEQQEAALSEQ